MMKVIMQVQLETNTLPTSRASRRRWFVTEKYFTKEKSQSSRHHHLESLIMKAKYFCILAYKHETDYNRSVSQTKRYGHQWSHLQKSRSTWSSRGGLAINLLSYIGSFSSSCQQPPPFVKWLSTCLYKQEDRPPRITSSTLNIKNYFLACSIKMQWLQVFN